MIELKQVRIPAGEQTIGPIDLRIETGTHCVLEGTTGCGKTSIVEAIAGLRKVVSGEVWLGVTEVTRHRPAERFVGYIPQDGVLFLRKTVWQNLSFGLQVARVSKTEINERVGQIAADLALTNLLERSARQLSGGERQRVAIGRALVMRPDVLLLDEPLSAMDIDTREQMEVTLNRWHQQLQFTALHISHSYAPGTWSADRVIKMDQLNQPA